MQRDSRIIFSNMLPPPREELVLRYTIAITTGIAEKAINIFANIDFLLLIILIIPVWTMTKLPAFNSILQSGVITSTKIFPHSQFDNFILLIRIKFDQMHVGR
jgi:hypothetical protein